jgi:hypothetical protein
MLELFLACSLSVEKQNSQLKGRNGFPLQATCFPVGERRIASSATRSVQGFACLAIPRESSSLPFQPTDFLAKVFK